MSDKITMKEVIMVFIVSLLGLSLTGTVAVTTTNALANLTSGTPAYTLLELFPLFWVIFLIAIPVVAIGMYLKE